jgi:hypothetical protein
VNNYSTGIYLYSVMSSGSVPIEHPMIRLIVNEQARISKVEVMASFQNTDPASKTRGKPLKTSVQIASPWQKHKY